MQFELTHKQLICNSMLFRGIDKSSLWRCIILIGLGSLLIAIGAKIEIPLHPVPLNLESLAVLFIGMTYGLRLGLLAVIVYLIADLCGAPLFAVPLQEGLTAGYLIGFLAAAALTGFLAERGWAHHLFSAITTVLIGEVIILLLGWLVLAQFIGVSAAFKSGIKPFLLIESLKVIILAAIVPLFWQSIPENR